MCTCVCVCVCVVSYVEALVFEVVPEVVLVSEVVLAVDLCVSVW